jgi:hypothetical protein
MGSLPNDGDYLVSALPASVLGGPPLPGLLRSADRGLPMYFADFPANYSWSTDLFPLVFVSSVCQIQFLSFHFFFVLTILFV